jgi:hypothetical protein
VSLFWDCLKFVANNSRFMTLPDGHVPILGSRILSLCQKRLPADWKDTFGHPVVLLETFVDAQHFLGTVYRSANWLHVGETKGFRRAGARATALKPTLPKRCPQRRAENEPTHTQCPFGS